MRFKVGVSYIGTAYGGFVRALDSRLPSIQGRIESALSAFLLSPDKEERRGRYTKFQVSSRTDAGVHALRNVFHVDVERQDGGSYSPKALVEGLNFYLSKQSAKKSNSGGSSVSSMMDEMDDDYDQDVMSFGDEMIRQNYRNHDTLRSLIITDAEQVDGASFDARMAIDRTYDYHIIAPTERYHAEVFKKMRDGQGGRKAISFDSLLNNRYMFHQHRAWQIPHPVDINEMRVAASLLVGLHDFSTFRNSGCQSNSPVRDIKRITVSSTPLPPALTLPGLPSFENEGPEAQLITITITADSFLLRMVRNITAALVHVSRTGGGRGGGGGRLHRAHDMSTMLGWKKRSMMRLKPAPAEGLYLRTVHYEDDEGDLL